jgi:hypothetical protein
VSSGDAVKAVSDGGALEKGVTRATSCGFEREMEQGGKRGDICGFNCALY